MAPWVKWIVSLFVVFQVGALVEWALPDNSPVKTAFYGFYEPYVVGTGTWQMWNMFSPDPSNLNLYVHATVTHRDGTTRDFAIPRMDKLDYVDRYEEERFRKYVENVHIDSNSRFWPGLARWIAAQDQRQTGKPVTRVQLIRTWWEVPAQQPPDASEPPPYTWHSYMFYDTKIKNGRPVNVRPGMSPVQ